MPRLLKQGTTIVNLVNLINTARIPTAQRVSTLEAEAETLRSQLIKAAGGKPARSGGSAKEEEDNDADAQQTERQREQEELKSAPNPINEYVEMLEEEVCLMFLLVLLPRLRLLVLLPHLH